MQNIISTTIAKVKDVTLTNLILYITVFFPIAETKALFNETSEINFTLSIDAPYADRKIVKDGLEFLLGIRNAQNSNSP